MSTATLGEITVSRIVESERTTIAPQRLFPEAKREVIEAERSWLAPNFIDEAGQLYMNIQAYVLKTRHHTILVDACVGNDKERGPHLAMFSQQKYPWLDTLKAAGYAPEDIDFVMCTHLHFDHVGWNTRLVDGRWVPTFPKAKYLLARTEWEYFKSEFDAGRDEWGAIGDSVMPVVEAGQAVIVEGDHALDDNIWLESTPGHTPGHVCVHAKHGGKEAILTGDLLHHPVQLAAPDWCVGACWNKAQSAATRRAFVERNADSDRLILAAHFSAPRGGYLQAAGKAWRFKSL
jgi:glyoxylase-like metal-dependent hydrolase (beta-lactamase superfamily II)